MQINKRISPNSIFYIILTKPLETALKMQIKLNSESEEEMKETEIMLNFLKLPNYKAVGKNGKLNELVQNSSAKFTYLG
jgi:hypothetical protein